MNIESIFVTDNCPFCSNQLIYKEDDVNSYIKNISYQCENKCYFNSHMQGTKYEICFIKPLNICITITGYNYTSHEDLFILFNNTKYFVKNAQFEKITMLNLIEKSNNFNELVSNINKLKFLL